MDTARKACVFVRDDFAGTLTFQADENCYFFAYDAAYLAKADASPVSLTLPLSAQTYQSEGRLFPFFDGLIPEGWLLDVVTSNWKIDRADRFGLLLVACKDCIGTVRIEEADV